MSEVDGRTKICVESDIQLAGSIAQYARGAAILQSTAQVIMNQFARNLEANLSGSTEAAKDIGMASTMAKGLWNAGKDLLK